MLDGNDLGPDPAARKALRALATNKHELTNNDDDNDKY